MALTQEELMYIADNVERLVPYKSPTIVYVAIACIIIGGFVIFNADEIDFPRWFQASAILVGLTGAIVCAVWPMANSSCHSIQVTVRQAAYLKHDQPEVEGLMEALENNELRLEKRDRAEDRVETWENQLDSYEKMPIQQLVEIWPKEMDEVRQAISEAIGRDFQWEALALESTNIDLKH